MGNIVQFRPRPRFDQDEMPDVDLMTAVDTAIRDLRDIASQCVAISARDQANECRLMLERAYDAAMHG